MEALPGLYFELGDPDLVLLELKITWELSLRNAHHGQHRHCLSMWNDDQQSGGSNASSIPVGLEDLLVSHLRRPTPEKPSDQDKVEEGQQTKNESQESPGRQELVVPQPPATIEPQNDGDIDPEFLAALPPDIQAEVLAQQQAQGAHRAHELEGQPVEIDIVSIIATFPSELREEVLLTSSDAVLANLTPALVAKANMLRERFARRYIGHYLVCSQEVGGMSLLEEGKEMDPTWIEVVGSLPIGQVEVSLLKLMEPF
ncbi:unnamed protein product [Lactuca saligna]|uniref:Uncharacterized protein n=1 Tax=Lactuca saligna TaxID=75948 RepID=A0AA35Y7I1_LACSI|nr:unnamed protein product [Lactuca saligna]